MNSTRLASGAEQTVERPPSTSRLSRLRRALPDPVTAAVVLTVATFALLGIGSPLVGAASFAGTDQLAQLSPQRDESMAMVDLQTINMGDTVDAALPNATLFGEQLRDGDYSQWNPYILGGVPLAATPNFAVLSPVALPFWILPGWLAPGYMKLLELVVAVGGSYLFLRRIRLGSAAAWLGGLVYASSGFLVVWTNWPQTRVAVFIPVLFWALERMVERRSATNLALVALPVAAMFLGGFPSVLGYALLTGGCYLLARVLAAHGRDWRRALGALSCGVAGVAAGFALVAFQIMPWLYFMSHSVVRGRGQGPDDHIPPELLLTSIAPYMFGTVNPADRPMWFHVRIFIEESFYVGAAAVVLVGVAVAAARRGRALLPRGLWLFLVAGTAVWTVLIFHGGLPLRLLQQLPVLFAENFVGRGRSILGFLLACLAAVGFQLLLNRRVRGAGREVATRLSRAYGIAVWLAAAAAGALLLRLSRHIAYQQNQLRNPDGRVEHYATHLMTEVAIGLGFILVTLLCVAYLWWGPASHRTTPGRRYAATVAAVAIPLLVGVQALMLVLPYHPRTDRQHFYPDTDASSYLGRHLGHQRFYGSAGAIYGGAEIPHRLRALHGHSYVDRRFAELLETMPGTQFATPPTYLAGGPADWQVARHPVLDRLAVRHYMVTPEYVPYGDRHADSGDGGAVSLSAGRPVTVNLTAPGPLRGIGVTPQILLSPPKPTSRVRITVRDDRGRTVADADKYVRRMEPGTVWYVPLAAEHVTVGDRLTVTVRVSGPTPIPVAARDGLPAISTVTSVDDGLRLVYDDSSVIYRRDHALPRARWASDVVVEPDARRRLALLAAGRVGAHQVVLDTPGAAAEGRAAQVHWLEDGTDELLLAVDAQGAGYLVIADALQAGWAVTVDGRPARLVPADHGTVAVAVPRGTHTVRLRYAAPYHNAGGWVSACAAIALLGAVGVEWRRRRSSKPV